MKKKEKQQQQLVAKHFHSPSLHNKSKFIQFICLSKFTPKNCCDLTRMFLKKNNGRNCFDFSVVYLIYMRKQFTGLAPIYFIHVFFK